MKNFGFLQWMFSVMAFTWLADTLHKGPDGPHALLNVAVSGVLALLAIALRPVSK